jgi:putative ABC transport system ATP-binding protein
MNTRLLACENMEKENKILTIKNVSKVYKDVSSEVVALEAVSFELEKGESLAIIGPSGSGKTTLLEIMAGLNEPTSGEVYIDGQNVHKGTDNEISKFRNKTMGFVFQMMHLQDYFTALENITLPLIAAGVSEEESKKRAEELLELVGLSDRKDHLPSKLSGGEMQRVAVARALANSPKIVLADEPTGKLDRKNADLVMDIFEKIQNEGVSVIIITHDEKIAKRYENVLELQHGRIKRKE